MSQTTKSLKDRPYTIINCAMSLDGKIALASGRPIKLSPMEDFKRVHELRNYSDAVLVGINTVIMDNPKLTVKPKFVQNPKNPIRIILDSDGRVPAKAHVVDGSVKTIIVMDEKHKNNDTSRFARKNVEIIYCPVDKAGSIKLHILLKILKKRGIENLMVEGGSTVIYNFLANKLIDELYVYLSNMIIGGTNTPTLADGKGFITAEDVIKLRLFSFEQLGDGMLLKYRI